MTKKISEQSGDLKQIKKECLCLFEYYRLTTLFKTPVSHSDDFIPDIPIELALIVMSHDKPYEFLGRLEVQLLITTFAGSPSASERRDRLLCRLDALSVDNKTKNTERARFVFNPLTPTAMYTSRGQIGLPFGNDDTDTDTDTDTNSPVFSAMLSLTEID